MTECCCSMEKASIPVSGPNQNMELSTLAGSSAGAHLNEGQNFGIHRVISASDMVMFPPQEDGPLTGQVSVAIQSQEEEVRSSMKPIFYLYPESNPEEDYKGKIDYSNPVILKVKEDQNNKRKLPACTDFQSQIPQTKDIGRVLDETKPNINFQIYKEDIYFSPFERYK